MEGQEGPGELRKQSRSYPVDTTRWWAVGAVVAVLVLVAHGVITWHGFRQHGQRLLRVADGEELSLAEAVADLAAARLVFLGEFHDQYSHHQAQLAVIQALHEADHPVAVGLEMFRADSQAALDKWIAGEISLEDFLPIYYANWNFPWIYYRDIFLYAREHGIPLVGLNVSLGVIQQVARGGFGSLSAEQVRQLPVVTCVVDAEYEEFIRRAMGMHGTHGRAFTNFCEAQLMWDTVMAINLLDYLNANPEKTVAVVAGRGHAWKGGIPTQVAQREPVPMRVVLPKLPAGYQQVEVRPEDADYFWLGLDLR